MGQFFNGFFFKILYNLFGLKSNWKNEESGFRLQSWISTCILYILVLNIVKRLTILLVSLSLKIRVITPRHSKTENTFTKMIKH